LPWIYRFDNITGRRADLGTKGKQLVCERCEEKLQGVHVEKYDEQQRRAQIHREVVFEAISPEELVVLVPHYEKHIEADGESREPLHGSKQFIEGVGDLQRHHEQRNRKGENGVGETFDAQYFLASPEETFVVVSEPSSLR
jgi:hypothetical protein